MFLENTLRSLRGVHATDFQKALPAMVVILQTNIMALFEIHAPSRPEA
jgi:hypothetical protein